MSEWKEITDIVNHHIKKKVADLQLDVAKLNAVDSLLGKDTTEAKKNEVLNTIFVVQDLLIGINDDLISRNQSRLMQDAMKRDS
jgi:hypothetical protein